MVHCHVQFHVFLDRIAFVAMASVVARLRPMLGRSVFAPSQGAAGASKFAMMQPMTSFSSMRWKVMASAKTAYVSETKVRCHSFHLLVQARTVRSFWIDCYDYEYIGMQGSPDTFEFRIFNYTADKDTVLSAWHDIPLYAGQGLLNFLCEIPKETSAKMELATDETRTPIKQDTKKGKLRHYPYNINWNYGMLPQTWEDPGHVDAELKAGVRCCCCSDKFKSNERNAIHTHFCLIAAHVLR